MKVTDNSQIQAIAASQPSELRRSTGAETSEVKADRVSTDTVKVSEVISQAAASAAGSRSAKVAAIAAQVKQGIYRPDPQAIADQILDDAELAAKLQAMLRH